MLQWSDDPVRDWDRYCEQQEQDAERCPKCAMCGEPIFDEYCYKDDGEYYCKDCFEDMYRVENPFYEY